MLLNPTTKKIFVNLQIQFFKHEYSLILQGLICQAELNRSHNQNNKEHFPTRSRLRLVFVCFNGE